MENNKKTLILTSFAQVISAKGIDKASMSSVAKQAQIPTSLIFYYFKNKEDMFNQLIDHIIDICCEAYFPEPQMKDVDQDCVEFIRRALRVHQYREMNTIVNRQIYALLLFQTSINDVVRKKYLDSTDMLLARYAQRLEYYNQQGVIRIKSPMDTARLLENMANGLNNVWTCYPLAEYEYWSEIIIDSYLAAVNYTGSYHKFLAYQNKPYPS